MATTYEKIATTTLGSATATITFNSIAASWTDIRLVLSCKGSGVIYPNFTMNNDASALYSLTALYGNGASAASLRGTSLNFIGLAINDGDSAPTFFTADIFSYAGSTFKSVLTTANVDKNGSGEVGAMAQLYRSTSAITRIDINGGGNNFASGTTATLYGILKA